MYSDGNRAVSHYGIIGLKLAKKKNNQIRFGVTDHCGHRAATWTVVNPYLKSDIYLTCRELRGVLKVSLHQSGSWHFGYSKEASEKHFESEETKYIEIWPRPEPITSGVTLAFRIVTPYSAVTTSLKQYSREINWISNCDIGYATEVDFIMTSPETIVTSWPGKNKMDTKLIGAFKLMNGETLWIVHWTIPMPDLSGFNNKPMKFYKGVDEKDLQYENLRAIAFGSEKDGSRVIFDCAVQKRSK